MAWSECCWNASAGGFPEFVDVAALGVEGREEGECLAAHGVFDQVGLPRLGLAERGVELCCGGVMRCWRPARRSAAAIRAFDSLAAAAGGGAIASSARASLLARLLAFLPATVSLMRFFASS
ncbi:MULTISPECIES: hypothetical protein [unclassified Kribbella]|uniref:hypothetical protein n=1 Tax=unclassified Kribbella TaxID=2644121 RepID=UPI0033DAD71F